jgi:hypothetical protein
MQSRGRPEGLQRVRHKKPAQPIRPLEQAPIGDTTFAAADFEPGFLGQLARVRTVLLFLPN